MMTSKEKEKQKQKLLAFMTTLIAAMEEHDISFVIREPMTALASSAEIYFHTANADRKLGDSVLIVSGREVAKTVINVADVRDAFCKKLMVKEEPAQESVQMANSTYKTTAKYSFNSIESLYDLHSFK